MGPSGARRTHRGAIGVLALQGDVGAHRQAFADLGVGARPIRRPEDLADLDGIVLPGGESTAISLLLESSGLWEPLSKELSAGMPVFGTCAGMILLAGHVADGRPDQRSFGVIDIGVRRNGWGRQTRSFESEVVVDALGEAAFPAVFIRAPTVESVGAGVEVLGTLAPSDLDLRRVPDLLAPGGSEAVPVLCRQGQVLVAAFHPELTPDRRLHALFAAMCGR